MYQRKQEVQRRVTNYNGSVPNERKTRIERNYWFAQSQKANKRNNDDLAGPEES